MTDTEKQQLLAVRASLTAALLTIDTMISAEEEAAKSNPTRDQIMSTMGDPEDGSVVRTFGAA